MLRPVQLTPTQLHTLRRALSTTYQNSRALHEKRVQVHSISWRKDVEVMRKMWGVESPIPKFLIESPPHAKEIQQIAKRQGWDISNKKTTKPETKTKAKAKLYIIDDQGVWHEYNIYKDIII